jgi:glycosyltransferase involved in cell wall biosynthesis
MNTPESNQPHPNVLLSLVAPCFNEAAVIDSFYQRISSIADMPESVRLEIIFINDGSDDDTLTKLITLSQRDARVKVLDLSRNFGKEAAMTAGLDATQGDVVAPIDVDLQDPPEILVDMLAKWQEGYEVVLAKRADRSSDSYLKRNSARWFYRVHNLLSDFRLPENVGDFRLMDRQVVESLRDLPERQRFMKGLFAWVGFRTATIEFQRDIRAAGETKFSFWKLWNFALEGITSFSTVPLRIWSYLGFSIALLAFIYALFIITRTLIFGVDLPGYASLLTVVLFLGGIQMIGIGVIGEYIGRTYSESKQRPLYIVRRRYEKNDA